MPTREQNQIGITECLSREEIINGYNGEIIENQDGTVSVFITYRESLMPLILSKTCCEVIDSRYSFDIETQKCRWSEQSTCSLQDSFKIVLNPKGNDGTLFYVEENDVCYLSVDFNYLFKIKCETLSTFLNGQTLQLKKTNSNSDEVTSLQIQLETQQVLCESYTNQLSEYGSTLSQLSYSIVCNSMPIEPSVASPSVSEPVRIKTVGNTAFGKSAPFGLGNTVKYGQLYCLTEPNGLNEWRQILGELRYNAFLNGDDTSYSCSDVQSIYETNSVIISNNMFMSPKLNPLIIECDTPINTKTNLINLINNIALLQLECQAEIERLTARINELQPPQLLSETLSCDSPIDFFENFDVSMSVDVITSANTLESVYSGSLITTIGSGNLYSYLMTNNNSGFYVCGDPTGSETQSNCNPLIINLTGGNDNNVFTCENVTNNLVTSLFNEYTGTSLTSFQTTFPTNAFSSAWLHYHAIITDPAVISKIINQKIKLSININHTCGDFCVLVDDISLSKICTHVDENNIFLTRSPGFELERIRDNKKSWLNNTTLTNRPFVINNSKGGNGIRQTNYDVNDERLVINSKEIDLDISIASAIESDIWCYLNDNTCLGEPLCSETGEISCPVGYQLQMDGITCQKIEYASYISGATVYIVSTGSTVCGASVTYGEKGGIFHPDITNLPWPITASTGGNLHVLPIINDASNAVVPIVASVLNNIWGNGIGSGTGDTTCKNWRLNKVGIWTTANPFPVNEWIGFSYCIDIPQTATYVLGIAGDDFVRFKLNGTLVIELSGFNFLGWRMFPIELSVGLNILEMQVLNIGGPATLGAEIYSASTSQLQSFTTVSELEPYIVWSTGSYVGQQWQTGQNSGISCPAGFALNNCSTPSTCVKITKTPAIASECCNPCLSECCGDNVDFNSLLSEPLSGITTIEDFEYFLTSELIDAKNRQTISSYATLRALYDRYINSGLYCGNESSKFDYMSMNQFASLIGTYWVDIVEQVIPATTIWGSTKIYSNTIFDQQKFKYKSYSSLFCGNPYSGQTILSPINGVSGVCNSVSVATTPLYGGTDANMVLLKPVTSYCESVCIAQMNSGSEFIGKISIVGPSAPNCDVMNDNSVNENTLQANVVINYPNVSVTLVGATQPVSYLWDNGATSPTTSLQSGNHSVTIIDGSCNEVTVDFTIPEQELTACWYNMQESPEFVMFSLACTSFESLSSITFNVSSFVLNNIEQISNTGYSKTMTSGTTNPVNWVSSSNSIVSGCTSGGVTGLTYTNFVDLLNEMFIDLGLTSYKAQISLNERVVAGSNSKDGFYIIRPTLDVFEFKTSDTSNTYSYNLKYKNDRITDWSDLPRTYYKADCSNITLVDGEVIE